MSIGTIGVSVNWLFEGKFNEVKSNEEVIEAYLGRGLKVKNTQND